MFLNIEKKMNNKSLDLSLEKPKIIMRLSESNLDIEILYLASYLHEDFWYKTPQLSFLRCHFLFTMKAVAILLILGLTLNQGESRLMWAPRQFLDAFIYPTVKNVVEPNQMMVNVEEPSIISTPLSQNSAANGNDGTGRVKVSPIGMFSYLLRLAEEQNRQQPKSI